METRHTVVTATMLSVVAVAVVAAVGVAVSPAVLAQSDDGTTNETANESSFGAQLSAFAQSTAADANATVDSGMWTARVNESSNPGEAVRTRATSLERRLHHLENRSEALTAARANGTINGVTYTAQASAVRAQLANLRQQVNETAQVADRAGVNGTKLADLRAAAGNATGPEVAAIARNITDAGRGPPAHAGGGDDNPGKAGGQSGNGSAGPPDNAGGPSENGPENPGNEAGGGQQGGQSGSGQPGNPGDGAVQTIDAALLDLARLR
ncbi:hypothetical protein ACKVMT_12125 [Halobacteriales archaeon Cl-PHB]